MDPKALRDLRLDVRLHRRHGWIERDDLSTALEDLPDVADKVETQDSVDKNATEPGASASPSES